MLRVLRQRVVAYLRDAERTLLQGAEPGEGWSAVRARLLPLVVGWRALLEQHGTGRRGRCRHCDRMWRRRRGLCSVWRVAHAHLGGGWSASFTEIPGS